MTDRVFECVTGLYGDRLLPDEIMQGSLSGYESTRVAWEQSGVSVRRTRESMRPFEASGSYSRKDSGLAPCLFVAFSFNSRRPRLQGLLYAFKVETRGFAEHHHYPT